MTTRSRLAGSRAARRRSRKAARSSGSLQRVKTSSNWSTRRYVSPSAGAASRTAAWVRAGCSPGVRMRSAAGGGRSAGAGARCPPPACGSRAARGSPGPRESSGPAASASPSPARAPPACSAGTSPARSSDDLPLPDAPKTAAKRRVRTSSTRSAVSRSRPKNRSRSPGSKRASPRYGGAAAPCSGGCSAASAAACRQRRSHSPGSPPQPSAYASATGSEGSRSPAAACDSAVTEYGPRAASCR